MSNEPIAIDQKLADWISESRGRLTRTVALRLDPRLVSRVDPSDVVQDAMLEATERSAEYVANPSLPPHLWLRLITIQRLALVHRTHLGVQSRSVNREVRAPLYWPGAGDSTQISSLALARVFVDQHSSPSQAVIRREATAKVQQALTELDDIDREVLALRHFEQLAHAEAAQVLGISEAAASKRYVRALRRMRDVLLTLGLAD